MNCASPRNTSNEALLDYLSDIHRTVKNIDSQHAFFAKNQSASMQGFSKGMDSLHVTLNSVAAALTGMVDTHGQQLGALRSEFQGMLKQEVARLESRLGSLCDKMANSLKPVETIEQSRQASLQQRDRSIDELRKDFSAFRDAFARTMDEKISNKIQSNLDATLTKIAGICVDVASKQVIETLPKPFLASQCASPVEVSASRDLKSRQSPQTVATVGETLPKPFLASECASPAEVSASQDAKSRQSPQKVETTAQGPSNATKIKKFVPFDEEYYALDPDKLELTLNQSVAAIFTVEDVGAIAGKPYCVEDYYKKTGWAQAVTLSPTFATITTVVICLNAIYIGIESDFKTKPNVYSSNWFFLMSSQAFAVFFTFELLARFFAFRNKCDALRDGWFKFDLFLVSTMVLDLWIVMPILKSVHTEGQRLKIPNQPLRLLRIARVCRMARFMETFPELITMTKGLVRSMRAIASTMIFIALMMYVWGIFIHSLLKDQTAFNDHLQEAYGFNFRTLPDTLWCLLLDGVLLLDNSGLIMTDMVYGKNLQIVLSGAAFTIFAMLSSLLILQMLIGVLCDVVSQVGQERRQADAIALVRQELLDDLKKFDDGDGKISQTELSQVLNNGTSKLVLKKLKINVVFFCELAGLLFASDKSRVEIKLILELLVLCRGETQTTVDILSSAFCFLTNEMCDMESRLKSAFCTASSGTRSLDELQPSIEHQSGAVGAAMQLLSVPK